MSEEYLDIVNEQGDIIGSAPRRLCHGDPSLTHRTVHVVVQSSDGRILLQKRSMDKDIQPGKWDTAVGGHLTLGESYEQAALREMAEEIGIHPAEPPRPLFTMAIRNTIESEQTRVFMTVSDGPFTPQKEELDALRFWTPQEIREAMGTGSLTPYLEHELELLFEKHVI